jgi:hypothetical protein
MAINFNQIINFESQISKLLKNQKGKDIIIGRFDLTEVDFNYKPKILSQYLMSFKSVNSVTYKLLYWEKNETIKEFIKSNTKSEFQITTLYRNGKLPGVLFINEKSMNEIFFNILILNHFNYEQALSPSLNIRVQLFLHQKNFITLMDIYDDRGFNVFLINNSESRGSIQ